jgi:hypothetical protein
LHAIVHDAPPDLLRDRADVSASMETIVSRLLRKAPEDRFQTAVFARGKLQKIAATGGPVTDIADAPDSRGGTWSPAGVIVFQPIYRDAPLLRVSDQGGLTQPVTTVDLEREDVSHR